MPELLPLTAADCATSTSETTSENQRKSKFAYRASGGQTARIPGITRFSIPVHSCGAITCHRSRICAVAQCAGVAQAAVIWGAKRESSSHDLHYIRLGTGTIWLAIPVRALSD